MTKEKKEEKPKLTDEEREKKIEAFGEELKALITKHGCTLSPQVVITNGKVQSGLVVEVLE